jgi:AcrR family transcriptional regulator
MQPRTKKDVVTEFRTGEILQAAYRVFAERGFEQATMDEIAKAAGVAKGTLYLYYPSKVDIYSAALHRNTSELAARTLAALQGVGAVEEKVQAVIAIRLRFFEEHRDFFRIYDQEFGRALCRLPHKGRLSDELYVEQVKALEQVLQQGVRRRAVRSIRTDAAAAAIFDITRGLALQRARGAARGPIEDDIAFAFDLTWKGIGHR